MAIKFFNIKSKETLVAETEPQIAALYNSSDKSPNANQGQDFGWRLAPAVVIEIRRIREDPTIMQRIAVATQRPLEDIDDKAILNYISAQTPTTAAPVATDADYSDEYNDEIRRLERESQKAKVKEEEEA